MPSKKMVDIDDITRQVRLNCDISDAQHAGLYSICGLALRLRDLYKWENQLPPWVERDSAEILKWIDARENRWDKLADRQPAGLSIGGHFFDPFDTAGINTILEPRGLYYAAGYAHSLKPTFLLARLEQKAQVDGHTVYTLGHELARDLLTIPALSRDDGIILRREAARLFLWDKIFYINKSGRPALTFALFHCGMKNPPDDELQRNLDRILAVQSRAYIYHEIGEREDRVFDRDEWREIIAAYPHTPVELAARAVKDLLADTGEKGPLQRFVNHKDAAALGFFVAFFDGLGKEFFPELRLAFQLFSGSGDWHLIAEAAAAGYRSARKKAETILALHRQGQCRQDLQWAAREIERCLLDGIGRHG
ncbi:MAG: hypothetical protein U5R30_03690 [Deltaproteobacteria bacterium]|nr:hypothetical protein [Deltaproteobacteria bacterium]